MATVSKSAQRTRRHNRLRKRIVGSPDRPRLVVNRSARHVFVQLVDDSTGHTLAFASTMEADLRSAGDDKTAKATVWPFVSSTICTNTWRTERVTTRRGRSAEPMTRLRSRA